MFCTTHIIGRYILGCELEENIEVNTHQSDVVTLGVLRLILRLAVDDPFCRDACQVRSKKLPWTALDR